MVELLTREETAKRLRISLKALDRLRQKKLIQETRPTPRRVRFTTEAIEQYVRDHTDCSASTMQAQQAQ